MNAGVCGRILDIARLFEMSASTILEPSFLVAHTTDTANCGTPKLVHNCFSVDSGY